MRWTALGVDYEMAGKDLIDSVRLSSQICRILGARPPEGFIYELFLDENGEKISKSRGNGLTIEEWLAYASPESLSLYMYQSPRKAKRLYFDVIPRAVDEYVGHLAAYAKEEPAAKLMNPVWHIHEGAPPAAELPISFALLLNLASASNSEDREVLWGFIRRYAPEATPEAHPLLDRLVSYAIRYFHDFVKPAKRYRAPTDKERASASRSRSRAWRRWRQACPPRRSRPRFMRSARSTASSRCATGSRRSTRCCSARRKGRASALSSSFTALRKPVA